MVSVMLSIIFFSSFIFFLFNFLDCLPDWVGNDPNPWLFACPCACCTFGFLDCTTFSGGILAFNLAFSWDVVVFSLASIGVVFTVSFGMDFLAGFCCTFLGCCTLGGTL